MFASPASAPEKVAVTVATTANSLLAPLFLDPRLHIKMRIWMPIAIAGLLALLPNGTTPGSYTVTVYAFTESNAGDGSNGTADANVPITLTVN